MALAFTKPPIIIALMTGISKLINEIIDLLSDEKSAISAGLLKTKVLLHLLGKKNLAEWVNHELDGYPNKDAVPPYRIIHARVVAQIVTPHERHFEHPVPIGHLTEQQQHNLQNLKMTESLSVLEDMVSCDKATALTCDLPLEMNGHLGKRLNDYTYIEKAWCQSPIHNVKGILTHVRSRLLDFILELKESLGDLGTEDNIKEKVAEVDVNSLFNNAVIGPNSTINIGHGNNLHVNQGVKSGNLETLIEALNKAGIPADEIEGLKSALKDDEKTEGKASWEGKTGKWFTSMLSKAAKGTVKIGVDVLSSTVAKAITLYAGGDS